MSSSNYNKRTILVIEDDKSISSFICTALQSSGYTVLTAADGVQARQMFVSHGPELILLDLGLPDIDGVEIIKWVREWSSVPIIVVSAHGRETDKVEALDFGADDYITKPFSPKELVLRVNNIIKRVYKDDERIIIDGYEIDENQRIVTCNGKIIDLTTKEFDLLMLFVKNRGTAFLR